MTSDEEQAIIAEPVTFYIDSDYQCYPEPGDGRREMQSVFFAGRESILTSYRFVPQGESWTHSNGTTFTGEMISLI